MSRQVEELAKPGQLNSLMAILSLSWEIIPTAGTQVGTLEESGATPMIRTCPGTTALFHSVPRRMIVKEVHYLGSLMLAICLSHKVGGLVKSGHHCSLTSTHLLHWETITTAETQLGIPREFSASPLIQICPGSTALFQSAQQC